MKIAAKINLSFLATIIILITITTLVFYTTSKNSLRNEIIARLEVTAKSRENHIKTYIKMVRMSVLEFSQSAILEVFLETAKDDPKRSEAFERAMTRLKRTKEANPSIHEFMVLDTSGNVVVSSDRMSIGKNRSAEDYFTEGRQGVYFKDAYYSENYSMPLFGVSAPITDSDTGELRGVLIAKVKLDELNKITTDATGMGKTGEIYIVNKDGYMVTPSRFKKDTFLKLKVDTENFRLCALHAGNEEICAPVSAFRNYMGEMTLGLHDFIPETKWSLLTEIGTGEIFAPLGRILLICAAILFFTPIAAWLIGTAVAGAITRPIYQLRKGIEVIGTGDLNHKVGTSAGDEIGQLSRAFDKMTEDLKGRTSELEELNKALRRSSGEVKHALQVKSEFLANMSHELRTPLNSIIGFSEVLSMETYGTLNKKQKDYINYVLGGGRHLLSLINDVLDLAKMEAAKAELMITTLSLKDLLREALILVKEMAFKKNIELSVEADEKIGNIDADERKLKQIVYNLLSNAVKFTPKDGKVGIKAKSSGTNIEIEVWDTGVGIAPENLEKIFEAFTSIKTPDVKTAEGTGLGLALSRKLVELHGGKIWAESKGLKAGAVFKFVIPAKAIKKIKA
ncbi:MAG: sensor histidine kinase [Candidatus Omnitrophica bacterium]|nr:sensor histidine kinase [Candidatus Omnitrophota bacterium]